MEIYRTGVSRFENGTFLKSEDEIVREEPFTIMVNGEQKYFCMRMPGMDTELATGLLFNDGIINSMNDIIEFGYEDGSCFASVRSDIVHGAKNIFSSAGGISSVDLISPVHSVEGSITHEELFSMQDGFFRMQGVFEKTGGVHACAYYNGAGELLSFAEDVGRHNAMDKCTGRVLIEGNDSKIFLILLSSRLSFEMVRKSYRAGAAVVAGVSAPTSAAVMAAQECGLTLIGFLRDGRFNVYSGSERVMF